MAETSRADSAVLSGGLRQFSSAWLTTFGLTLILVLVSAIRSRPEVYDLADRVLLIMLVGLGLGWFLSVIYAVAVARLTVFGRVLYVFLALVMLLPLLWAPVLGAVVAAWLTGATIEYSTVYAQFRIHVAQILFPATTGLMQADLLEAAWSAFEVVATVVGFLASVVSLWPLVMRQLAPSPEE